MASKAIFPNSVLIIGASGYIGLAVGKAFRRAGYYVYGLIRNESKAALLQANEIIPVIGDADKLDTFKEYIAKTAITIDASSTFTLNSGNEIQAINILKAVEEASKHRDPLTPPKTYIYTSGLMVYGHDDRVRDETYPISSTTYYAEWRRKIEEATIHSTAVNGVVLRPGWVFGGSGGPFVQYFQKVDKIVFYGSQQDRRYSWIHIEDLAESYVATVRKIAVAKGLIFNITNGYDNPLHTEVFLKGTKLDGQVDGKIHWEPATAWQHKAIDASVITKPTLAIEVLGWTPKIFGFVDNLGFYYESYKASLASGQQ